MRTIHHSLASRRFFVCTRSTAVGRVGLCFFFLFSRRVVFRSSTYANSLLASFQPSQPCYCTPGDVRPHSSRESVEVVTLRLLGALCNLVTIRFSGAVGMWGTLDINPCAPITAATILVMNNSRNTRSNVGFWGTNTDGCANIDKTAAGEMLRFQQTFSKLCSGQYPVLVNVCPRAHG